MKIVFAVTCFISFAVFAQDLPPISTLDVNTRAICASIYGVAAFICCVIPHDRN